MRGLKGFEGLVKGCFNSPHLLHKLRKGPIHNVSDLFSSNRLVIQTKSQNRMSYEVKGLLNMEFDYL
jgi:hypothetical protein